MSKKSLEYQIPLMKEKTQNMYSRLLRKYSMVEDFHYSSRDVITVKEKMLQLKDMFRLLMSLRRSSLNA